MEVLKSTEGNTQTDLPMMFMPVSSAPELRGAPALGVSPGRRPLIVEDEAGGLSFDADVLRDTLVMRGAGAPSESQLAEGRAIAAAAAATEQSASLGPPPPSIRTLSSGASPLQAGSGSMHLSEKTADACCGCFCPPEATLSANACESGFLSSATVEPLCRRSTVHSRRRNVFH